jgi:hypothetical protein
MDKRSITAQQAIEYFLRFFAGGTTGEKLECYFEVFNIPREAVKNPEVQRLADQSIAGLRLPGDFAPESFKRASIELIQRLFKS